MSTSSVSVKPPIRVGLLVDSFSQPHWVCKVVNDIASSTFAKVVLVVLNDHDERKANLIKRLIDNRHYWSYLVYEKLDNLLSRVTPNAFEIGSIQELVSDCPVIRVNPKRDGYSDYIEDHDLSTILDYDLDVAIQFGFRRLTGPALRIAKYGVWSYHHGDNLVNRGGPAGFWEVVENNPVTGSVLQILTGDLDGGQVIYRSYAATYSPLVTRSKSRYFWKSSAFVIRKLRDLQEGGPAELLKDPGVCTYSSCSNRLYKTPRNSEMVALLPKLVWRYSLGKAKGLLYFDQAFLAYGLNGNSTVLDPAIRRFKQVFPPKDRSWADPFPIKEGDRYYLFLEEYLHKERKGHISVMEINQDGYLGKPVTVLEREYHLSYPFVFQWQGSYYMIPETGQNRTIELYRCVAFPYEWAFEKVLLDNINAVDATLTEVNGTWWMFVNIAIDGASAWDELHLYHSDTPLGPWKPHSRNPVKSDVRSARPAGNIFRWNGDIYRPAQDCSKRYGYAISINKIMHLDQYEYQETEVSKILPDWAANLVGTHTFSTCEGLTVVDGLVGTRKYF